VFGGKFCAATGAGFTAGLGAETEGRFGPMLTTAPEVVLGARCGTAAGGRVASEEGAGTGRGCIVGGPEVTAASAGGGFSGS
jgi:hypothetical protein